MPQIALVEALMKSPKLQVQVECNKSGRVTVETAALAKVRVRENWVKWVTMPESHELSNHLSFLMTKKVRSETL